MKNVTTSPFAVNSSNRPTVTVGYAQGEPESYLVPVAIFLLLLMYGIRSSR